MRTSAKETGDASGSAYANTGVHYGDVNLHTGMPVRTRYIQQVRRIAPVRLDGRSRELQELRDFCLDETLQGRTDRYRYIEAEAWSGKTALLSWFTLNPPIGTRIVSFFITARLASQDSRLAFIDNVLEQLATVLNEPLPEFLNEHTREAHLLGMLSEAAELCRIRGETLVLLVDGLDEDRGVTTGPEAHSIVALLPSILPLNMRMVVAGRPNPPLPVDVDDDHPLREESVRTRLEASPEARAIRSELHREIKRLVTGDRTQRDLLGFVCASRGGLTQGDLTELIGEPQWQVADHLSTVTGRSFSVRPGYWSKDEIYLLAHDELQTSAEQILGDELTNYHTRIDQWFLRYEDAGWPAHTPEYLLLGHFDRLHRTKSLVPMLQCATDWKRHLRLLDRSAATSAIHREIDLTTELLCEGKEPSISELSRLSVHSSNIQNLKPEIAAEIPAVWVKLGSLSRAEALMDLVPQKDLESALLNVIEAINTTRVATMASHEAHYSDLMELVATKYLQQNFLSSEMNEKDAKKLVVAATVAALYGEAGVAQGYLDLVDRAIDSMGIGSRNRTGSALAHAFMQGGDLERALSVANRIPSPARRRWVVADVMCAALAGGSIEKALEIIEISESKTTKDYLVMRLTRCLGESGDFISGRRLIKQYTSSEIFDAVAASFVDGLLAVDTDRADDLEKFSKEFLLCFGVQCALARKAATTGRLQMARVLVSGALTLKDTEDDPFARDGATIDLAVACERLGQTAFVETLFNEISDGYLLAAAAAALADAAIERHDVPRAHGWASRVTDQYDQTVMKLSLMSKIGDSGGESFNYHEVLETVRAMPPSPIKDLLLAELAKVRRSDDSLIGSLIGEIEGTGLQQVVLERLCVDAIKESNRQRMNHWMSFRGLPDRDLGYRSRIALDLAREGHLEQARELALEVEAAAREFALERQRVKGVADLASGAIACRDFELARSATKAMSADTAGILGLFVAELSSGGYPSDDSIDRLLQELGGGRDLVEVCGTLFHAGEFDSALGLSRFLDRSQERSTIFSSLLESVSVSRARADLMRFIELAGAHYIDSDEGLSNSFGRLAASCGIDVAIEMADVCLRVGTARASVVCRAVSALNESLIQRETETAPLEASMPDLGYWTVRALATDLARAGEYTMGLDCFRRLRDLSGRIELAKSLVAGMIARGKADLAFELVREIRMPAGWWRRQRMLQNERLVDALAQWSGDHLRSRVASAIVHPVRRVVLLYQFAIALARDDDLNGLLGLIEIADDETSYAGLLGHEVAELAVCLAYAGEWHAAWNLAACCTEIERQVMAMHELGLVAAASNDLAALDQLMSSEIQGTKLVIGRIPMPDGYVRSNWWRLISRTRSAYSAPVAMAAVAVRSASAGDLDEADQLMTELAGLWDSSVPWRAVLEASKGSSVSRGWNRPLVEVVRRLDWPQTIPVLLHHDQDALRAGVDEARKLLNV